MDPFAYFLLTILVIIGNGWWIWYKQYETKKGENRALKEDIEELTEKVEQVKAEFNVNLEKVKAELQFLNTHQFSYAVEERNAIYAFLEAYHKWLSLSEHLETDDLSDDLLTKKQRDYAEAFAHFNFCQSKLFLFPTDEDSINRQSQLAQITLALARLRSKYQYQIRVADTEVKRIAQRVGTTATLEDHKKALEKKSAIQSEFLDKSIDEIQKPLRALFAVVRERFKDRLQELFHTSNNDN